MGRRRKKFQLKGDRKDKGHYKDIVKENQKYEHYYKEQQCFDVSEFSEFITAMKQPLPAVFRITGYKKHAKQLLKNMKMNHFVDIANLKINNEIIKPPASLPWYPEELAWKTNLNRTQIRKAPQLEKFHAFLIAETESGHITRQEAVSMIPPLLLDVQPHHKVLDMCAAPGSKTAQIIELLHQDDTKPIPDGLCIANDKDNRRCYMLVHQMNRLNSPASIVVNHDAATFPEIYLKNEDSSETALRYDRVLCDVPCSGDGTMRKNSDVWLKWNIANSIYLHGIQLRILIRGLELLATGGQLVYSTCSLNPIEDEAVVAAALSKCSGAVELCHVQLPDLKWSPGVSKWKVMDRGQNWYEKFEDLPENVRNITKTMFPPENEEMVNKMHLDRCMRLLPHHQDTGGFFVSVLRKVSNLPWQTGEKDVKNQNSKDSPKQPQRKKPRWGPGFKEDPFVFFTKDDESLTSEIRSFYGLGTFPFDQVLSRSTTGKKKHLYFVSHIVKNIVENNINFLKVINTGVRTFSRSDNTHANIACSFRIVQDGVECVEPSMSKQVVKIKIGDVIKLLVEEQPKFNTLSDELRTRLSEIDSGSMIYKYVPDDDNADVSCDLLMCGWKGHVSSRLYMCKNERMHFLNMVGHPVPEHLLPNKNTRRTRAENGQGKDKEPGDDEDGNSIMQKSENSDVNRDEKESVDEKKEHSSQAEQKANDMIPETASEALNEQT
ncbi:RNA cytosine C(5)-methyltransferase NSUN2-like [Clavelina lepadiformis]|uniref:RNA cytosine C(5)-methyltransferase NSUN2-like n=1 Tax=Clavelina lepadiformis TaxID=159417 RepID=UPI0040425EE9